MDILDIDEALKDDSYIFLADKTHDDISNILHQWKTNNQQHLQQHLQPSNEEAYKHNSKTFTRPKRKSQAAEKMETQFTQTTNVTSATNLVSPMLSLEIGGLVTNLHKSLLQDTSPPSSICTSINNGCMNSSLISSADFTNLNFLQSIHSLETNNTTSTRDHMSTMTTLLNDVGYNLSDMIRDRKVLESLSMSGDGTLIKDSHIGQIDDISLMPPSKTASGCSTMDNSTDSVSTPNEMHLLQQSHVHNQGHAEPQLCTTMVLSEELIGDTTFNLVDSLTSRTTTESQSEGDANVLFKRPIAVLNETQLLAGRQVNSTFTEGCHTPEAARCDTPENIETKLSLIQMQSTPLTTLNSRCPYNYNNNNKNNYNNNNNKVPIYTPTQTSHEEIVNISPIVSSITPHKSYSCRQELNHTYEPPTETLKNLQIRGAPECFDGQKVVHDTMHLLEQIEQPATDATYDKSDEYLQMQCVLDLAEAEVELLAHQGDEEQFEHMLAELGRVNTLNAEQIKMQKSLDSIKRRFQKDEHPSRSEQQPQVDLAHDTPPSSKSHLINSLNQSMSQSSNSSERLLSRRSRLYDDVKLTAMHDNVAGTASCNSTSFLVHRREDEPSNTSGTCIQLFETEKHTGDMETEQNQTTIDSESLNYKMAERRTRDRERFKTIKITSEMHATDEKLGYIVVPCIDDEDPQSQPLSSAKIEDRPQSPQNRLSRLDKKSIGNINGSENNAVVGKNYLTYKKPRDKNLLMQKQPQTQPPTLACGQNARSQPRSLSRPRYISGLQKLGTVSKATSAGGGLNAVSSSSSISRATSRETAPKPGDGVKSPMGIKSKSFHNLSSNICSSMGAGGEVVSPRQSLGDALKIPSNQASKLSSVFRAAQQNEDETSVFKVPKLVGALRAPSNTGGPIKRVVGLARPSSGYYSLTMRGVGDPETPESLSSASSRGSLYDKDAKQADAFEAVALSAGLGQVTSGTRGIPKPSALRQPTQIKRSGLPRPSNILRR
ncbi:uncharacterized protein LOC6583647 isoform X2 [Drosophila mojavensis]|uniref:Uncharacterized protein, isoform A n=2 Tax=Drosophila mojavensis TaxID=7230 RepID=B4KY69_DROMO|nr:uncharacterized protein LOC6583647 isoform X2 [Drosophila mojavensis]EDW19788.1 uncharacterized protein Dmoj_GI11312, isoform A [Drosophila mojavensis]KRG06836.1 uncharacterized protein Dmoj_GI11312, isoform C [Drosophila mojavensis]